MSCTSKCWEESYCPDHNQEMHPWGRSLPMYLQDCCDNAGNRAVNPRHLWDIHDSDRYYRDRDGWDAHYSTCDQCNTEPEEAKK
jgi:hypothetical protein